MAGIQSSTGLITGIPIEETVNKLMAIAARPRSLLDDRTKLLRSEQLAVTKLSSLVLAFKFESDQLGRGNLFKTKAATTTDKEVLNATIASGGNPPVGSYKFRVLQTASAQQLLSNDFESPDDFGVDGSLSFGFGGFVDTGVSLAELNGGDGVAQGWIRITDRAGHTADIDLRSARTVDDVLRAVNENIVIDVTASTDGDRFTIVDHTGGSGNLRVQEVGAGATAADLGLSAINVAANTATGNDVFALGANTKLASLNDGNGVELTAGNDLTISLADGTSLDIDLDSATTLGEVLETLNAANPAKFSATIAPDGKRLKLTDLTAGGDTFSVASVGLGSAAKGLGLTAAADDDTITGNRLLSGLRDSLVHSLHGGQGLGTLGQIDITNRNNVASSVDLSAAETLAEIVEAINDQATGVTAAINSARNGITLSDTTGATLSNLIIADGDSTDTATGLGIATNSASSKQNSGSLARQQVSRATLLSSLNQGAGISLTDFRVTDSAGHSNAVDVNAIGNEAKTVGDVIDRINALAGIDVEARVNDTGDGILLVDAADGNGTLTVAEVGNGTAAADLRILGSGVATEIDGQTVQAIDGTSRYTVELGDLGVPGSNIQLSSLNDGEGLQLGAFKITDSAGSTAAVLLNSSAGTFETVADVIDAINATDIGIEARIDDSGSGILLFDTAGGEGTLQVVDLAGGTTAADLRLNATVKSVEVDGELRQTIDGLGAFSQSVDQSALGALVSRINALQVGVTASTVFDGNGYRFSLSVDKSGTGNELLVDGLDADLDFSEFSAARDAVIEFGGAQLGTGFAITSSTNTFDNIVSGLELTAIDASDTTVSVSVTASSQDVVDTAQHFVDAYNSIRTNLDQVTDFDPEAQTTGILFGTTAALRVEAGLSHIVSGRFFGLGKFSSLEAVGITLDDKGKLSLNKTKLRSAFDDDPNALANFFAQDVLGVSAKLGEAVDRLAGENSALSSRVDALRIRIENNTNRLDGMDELLDRQRERLFNQFSLLESTIATLQRNLSALDSLQIIPPLSGSSNS